MAKKQTTRFKDAVLLINDEYGTARGGVSTINRQVSQILTWAGIKVYCTVLEATEEDRKDAEADGVELILPTCSQGDTTKPCLDWLTFHHRTRYPSLPQDVGCIVGHADVTSRAATAIKEQRFPHADLSLIIHVLPEDTEHFKEDEKAMGIGKKEDSIVQDAEKANTVFSVGHNIYDHFNIMFCAIPKEKRPTHHLFLPAPSKIFQEVTMEYLESREKVVLSIGRVRGVEKLKGHDLAGKSIGIVAELSKERVKWRVRGGDAKNYATSKNILQNSTSSGKLVPTLLPYGTQEDICRDMQQAHLVLMPSRAEPFGLVGLEAMAAGVPILISDQSGLATLVEKVIPEFHHCVVRMDGDESVVVRRWAERIEKVLKMSRVEFGRAAELKEKLLESRYWEESHRCFLLACGGKKSSEAGIAQLSEDACVELTAEKPDEKASPGKSSEVGPARLSAGEPGVSKYFYFIKRKVSSDWMDLATHLGFGRADIDSIAGRVRDDKSRCMDLLQRWLTRNKERATIEVLMEALSEANLLSTVDELKNEYPELDTPQAPGIQQKRKMESGIQFPAKRVHFKEENVFQMSVKRYYKLKLTTFKPLIWNDYFTLALSDIFTELELVKICQRRPEMPVGCLRSVTVRERQREKLNSLDDIFNPIVTGLLTSPRCILIEGEAGAGKTTFMSKEALDAVLQKTELGRRHDIVLLIRLREVREEETIEEMVWDQCVPETAEGVDVLSIRAILQRNESRVLFLLDGYDELRPESRTDRQAIPKLLSGKMYPNSSIVVTSRPSAGMQQCIQPDCHLHIKGFSPANVKKYVRQYFNLTGSHELARELIKILNESQVVTDLIHTPIFLAFVCLLWEENPEMVSPGTMTGLYNNLLTCLGRKHCKREGVAMPTDELPENLAKALLQLGKLALEALLKNETLVDLTEVERENMNWELLLKLGVVSLEVSASKLHPRKQLNFSHKTMQEYLAGKYVAHALVSQDIVGLLNLTSISKALKHGSLLKFTCGCDLRAAEAVVEELGRLNRKELSQVHADDFNEKFHVPVKQEVQKTVKVHREVVLLCLDILNERKELNILQAVCQVLPVIIFDNFTNRKQHATLNNYLQNIQSSPSHMPEKMILRLSDVDGTESGGVQYLEETFTHPIPGLRLDLDLSHAPLDSLDKTHRLVSVLKNIPGLRALELSSTKLRPSSLQAIVHGFKHVSLLEELDLTFNPELGDAGMEVLPVGLSSVPHLTALCLREVSMTAVGMLSLVPYIHHLVKLKELDVSYNEIGDTGLESLSTVLRTLTAMQVLILQQTGISSNGMHTLVPALCYLTGLVKLEMSWNTIGDPGLDCLAGILPQLRDMKVLVLVRTGISDRGISALVKALPHLVQLQVLNVSNNNIGDSGIVSLVQTLCHSCGLDGEQNPPGVKSLTAAPHYNTTLQKLNIGRNREVTGVGLERVTQLISALPALTKLYMSGDTDTPAHLSDTAAMDLAKALPRLPALEWLILCNVSMEPAGFQAVVQAAEEHPALERLNYRKDLVPWRADTTAHCLRLVTE